MESKPKKMWQLPDITLISRTNEIQGGAGVVNFEVRSRPGDNYLSTPGGGSGGVPATVYQNAHS